MILRSCHIRNLYSSKWMQFCSQSWATGRRGSNKNGGRWSTSFYRPAGIAYAFSTGRLYPDSHSWAFGLPMSTSHPPLPLFRAQREMDRENIA